MPRTLRTWISMEIERKFLVLSSDYRQEAKSSSQIIQGFLNTNPERTVRIRIKGDQAFLTIKGKSNAAGTIRKEWEVEIDRNEALSMLDICEGPIIKKKRYFIQKGDHEFEVDEFSGDNSGLILAEIELMDEDEDFIRPSWLGEEVTGDIRYYNSQLSKTPYQQWKD